MGVTFAALLGLMASTAFADKAPANKKPAPAAEKKEAPAPAPADAGSAAGSAAADPAQDLPPGIDGPHPHYDLGNNAEIDIPAGFRLVEKATTQEFMRQEGGDVSKVMAALIQPGKNWLMLLEYDDIGYIEDDDADKLDAGELLQGYKEGTAEMNKTRKQNNIPELFVDGWSESPRYEKASHHLVWGLKAHTTEGPVINFFTRVLSRNGYMSINLVDSVDKIEASKVEAAPLYASVHFKTGFRYEDHKDEDKSSGMGLRTLVLGGAAVGLATKGGIFLKLLLIFKKAAIFIVVGIGGFFKWLFGKKKKDVDPGLTPPPYDPTNPGPPPAPPHDINQV